MREIVFDTETTGLSHSGGDRMVEIGCVEIVGGMETGRSFHAYFNPDRGMPADAEAVHGLTSGFLSAQPRFVDTAADLLAFLADDPLVAHNAPFDFGFLNAELALCGRAAVPATRMRDTLAIAKRRHPGAKLSLDALCSRYGIDRSHRVRHGALLDAQLLARVYLELNGGAQIGMALAGEDGPRPRRRAGAAPTGAPRPSAPRQRGGTRTPQRLYRPHGRPDLGAAGPLIRRAHPPRAQRRHPWTFASRATRSTPATR